MKHLNEPPTAVVEAPGIPADLDRVVVRALAKTPQDRYQSAEEFDADLARIERGLAVSAETADAATAVLAGAGAAPTQVHHRADPGARHRAAGRASAGGLRPTSAAAAPVDLALAARPPAPARRRDRRGLVRRTTRSRTPRGVEPVAVPNVEGHPGAHAVQKIEEAGPVRARRDRPDETSPESSSSRAPRRAPDLEERRSTILVSTGVEKVEVPKVVGRTGDQAIRGPERRGPRAPRSGRGLSPTGSIPARHRPGPEARARRRRGLARPDQRLGRRAGRRPRRPPAVRGERRGGAPRAGFARRADARRERPAGSGTSSRRAPTPARP